MIERKSTDLEIYALKGVMFYQMLETGDQNSSADLSAASAPLRFDLFFATSIGFPVAQRTDSAAP